MSETDFRKNNLTQDKNTLVVTIQTCKKYVYNTAEELLIDENCELSNMILSELSCQDKVRSRCEGASVQQYINLCNETSMLNMLMYSSSNYQEQVTVADEGELTLLGIENRYYLMQNCIPSSKIRHSIESEIIVRYPPLLKMLIELYVKQDVLEKACTPSSQYAQLMSICASQVQDGPVKTAQKYYKYY